MDRTAGVDFLDTHSHYSSDSASYRAPSSSGEWVPPGRPPTHSSFNSIVEDLMRTTRREVEGFEGRLEVLEEEKNIIKSTISTYNDYVSNVLDVEHKLYVLDLRTQAIKLGVQGVDTRLVVVEKDLKEVKEDVKEMKGDIKELKGDFKEMNSNLQLILAHLNIQPVKIERIPEPAPPPQEASETSDIASVDNTTPPQIIPEINIPPPFIPPAVQQTERQTSFSRSLPSLPEPARELEEEMNNLTKGMLKLRGNFSSFLRKSMANLRQ